jgi:Fe-S cluster biosynthesis and repair protein YggX
LPHRRLVGPAPLPDNKVSIKSESQEEEMAEVIKCARCGQKLPSLEKPPFGNALGKRIHEQICQSCWKGWLMTQNQLINHYGLSTINPEHQQFLIDNMESFLFGQGLKTQIDTSLQGTITH